MSLLTICQDLARDVGLDIPDTIMSSAHREWTEARVFSEQAAEEIARRADWGALSKSTTVTGTGANVAHTLPSDLSRIVRGIGVTASGATVRPLTRAEWASLTPTEGAPRYFLLEGQSLTLWPYLASGQTATVYYQSANWSASDLPNWASDSDTALISESLITKALLARWRRQKGMDYADYEAEYEAALAQLAEYDDRSRL